MWITRRINEQAAMAEAERCGVPLCFVEGMLFLRTGRSGRTTSQSLNQWGKRKARLVWSALGAWLTVLHLRSQQHKIFLHMTDDEGNFIVSNDYEDKTIKQYLEQDEHLSQVFFIDGERVKFLPYISSEAKRRMCAYAFEYRDCWTD